MSNNKCSVNFEQTTLNEGDKFTIGGVCTDSLGRKCIGGKLENGDDAIGDLTLIVFTAQVTNKKKVIYDY
ncbi:MAG TPA: hypothetical protein EYN54_03240 [Methylococcaceae bacterium]|nr:hypothetical protein [Methylococcaceae bacterium]